MRIIGTGLTRQPHIMNAIAKDRQRERVRERERQRQRGEQARSIVQCISAHAWTQRARAAQCAGLNNPL